MKKSDRIGTHVRLEPFDRCGLPPKIFPLRGKVVRKLHAIGGADDLYRPATAAGFLNSGQPRSVVLKKKFSVKGRNES
jgi:hypothetical protein